MIWLRQRSAVRGALGDQVTLVERRDVAADDLRVELELASDPLDGASAVKREVEYQLTGGDAVDVDLVRARGADSLLFSLPVGEGREEVLDVRVRVDVLWAERLPLAGHVLAGVNLASASGRSVGSRWRGDGPGQHVSFLPAWIRRA